MLKQIAKYGTLIVLLFMFTACGSGGGSGSNAPQVTSLPATGINFDTSKVAVGEVNETLKSETKLVLGEPQMVTYPYDINDPNNASPQATHVEVRMACTTKTYDIKSNPEKILLHGINDSHRWPGALLQGALYRDGTMQSLNVAGEEREPVTVIIKNVYNNSGQSSSRTVENPSQSTITDAVNALIIDGYNDNLPLGGSVVLNIEETKDARRALLKGKLSARYGTVKGSLQVGVDKSQSHNSLIISMTQNLFDVVVQEPPSKEAWFNDAFYQQSLSEKIANGEISETNPPVYVSKVTYGRILNYTMTSTASRSDLQILAKLSADTLVAGASVSLSTKQKKVQENLKKTIISIGGNAASALTAANSGNWGDFFKEKLSLTEAVPIAFEFKNVFDNSPAGVTEVTEYSEEICTPQVVVPGPFDFALEDLHKRPLAVGNIQKLASADFNGDGRVDIVWNHLLSGENRFYVGYGTNEGRFNIQEKACAGKLCNFSGNGIPWGQFKLHHGDMNGDGKEDLIWTRFEATDSRFQIKISLATADGFESELVSFSEVIDGNGLQDHLIVSDMNNDGKDDLVLWFVTRNSLKQTVQDYQILRTTLDPEMKPGIAVQSRVEAFLATDISPATTRLSLSARDVNSDGWNDLLWGLLGQRLNITKPIGARNVASVSINQRLDAMSDISLVLKTPVFIHSSPGGWSNYVSVSGDFDGDGDGDLAWIRNRNGQLGAVHQANYDLAGQTFIQGTAQNWEEKSAGELPVTTHALIENNENIFTIDVNGDGQEDVVVTKFLPDGNLPKGANGIVVMTGLFKSAPFFNGSTAPQQHPVKQDWAGYGHVFVGDVNGDGLQDVIWNNAALDNSIYVAIAKSK